MPWALLNATAPFLLNLTARQQKRDNQLKLRNPINLRLGDLGSVVDDSTFIPQEEPNAHKQGQNLGRCTNSAVHHPSQTKNPHKSSIALSDYNTICCDELTLIWKVEFFLFRQYISFYTQLFSFYMVHTINYHIYYPGVSLQVYILL